MNAGDSPKIPISLVTGGGRGIGRATALALAARGHDLLVTYVSKPEPARALVAELQRSGRRAAALALDLGAPESFDHFVEDVRGRLQAWGRERFDDLINNAGTGGYSAFESTTPASFDELFAVHVKGPYFLTQKLLPLLEDGAHIVNLSSGLSRYVYPGFSAYSAAKGAIDALTRALAVELGPRRITVNAVAPGGVATEFGGGVMLDPSLQQRVAAETPLGRVAEPSDVGDLIATLVSHDARWLTGQRIEATGGYRL